MIDVGAADDKIIAVLENDPIWAEIDQIEDLPGASIERMRHYSLTPQCPWRRGLRRTDRSRFVHFNLQPAWRF